MTDLNLRDYFYDNLSRDKVGFYYRGKFRTWKYSFKQVLDNSLRFSALLRESGLKKGDRIIIKAESGPDWLVVFLGCVMAGVVVVPLDLQSSRDFLKRVIGDAEPKLLVTSREQEEEIKDISIEPLFIEDLEESISSRDPYDYKEVAVEKDDIVEIIYTSGTTSAPKGVMLSYKNIEANLKMALPLISKWKKFLKYVPRSKLLSIVPLSHMYGQVVGLFVPISIDLTVFFSYSMMPKDIFEVIRKERIIAVGALPHQLKAIKDYMVDTYNLGTKEFRAVFEKYKKKKWWIRFLRFFLLHMRVGSSWLGIISGGAEVEREVDEFYRTLAFGFFQGYGLTETAPIIALYDPTKNKAGSVGSFLNQENIKVEDGELYVKGETVTPGYFKNKQKTSQSFEDGWFKTGDLVEVDESGNVFFKGRKDDVIVKESGINVYPSDIEDRFTEDEEIDDCVVFGMEGDGKKNIVAVLLPKDRDVDQEKADKIVERINSELNVHQRVDDYFIWRGKDFPRTPTMNVKKGQLLEKIKETQKGEKSKLASDLAEEYEKGDKQDIYSIIEKIKKSRKKKDEDATLEKDLGMDSMDIISFSSEIEKKYGVDASQLDLSGETKIKDIEEKLKNPPKKSARLPFFPFAYNYFFIILRTIFQYLIFPFIRMLYRTRIDGKQNLQNLDTPTAFISNHVSVMDTLVILFTLPLKLRAKMTVVMSIGHHFNHFFGRKGNILRRFIEGVGFYLFISLYINVIPLSQEFGFGQVFKNAGKAVDRGWNVLIFPEGSVTEDGSLQKFEPGIGVICKDMKLPVVPMKIDGLFNILKNGILPIGHMPKLPMVEVSIGEQVYRKQGSYEGIAESFYHVLKDEL
ncbi:MAG: AMP-binding protein [Actinomycetota bacterium]